MSDIKSEQTNDTSEAQESGVCSSALLGVEGDYDWTRRYALQLIAYEVFDNPVKTLESFLSQCFRVGQFSIMGNEVVPRLIMPTEEEWVAHQSAS